MPRKIDPIRWTVARASSEFGLNPRTLSTRIRQAGVLPGPDHKFSTADIHKAICGDYQGERLRLVRGQADQTELANAEKRHQLVDKTDFLKRLEPLYVLTVQKIMASSMSDLEKDTLRAELCKIHSL